MTQLQLYASLVAAWADPDGTPTASGAASAMAAPTWKIFFLTIPPLRPLY